MSALVTEHLVLQTAASATVSEAADRLLGGDQIGLAVCLGVAATVVLMAVFLAYQGWRYRGAEAAAPREEAKP
jgi:hypothetical protein